MFFSKKSNLIELRALHISGTMAVFELDLDEFKTDITTQREELDSFLKNVSDLLATTDIGEREIFAEFGHHKIRVNDFSTFSLIEA